MSSLGPTAPIDPTMARWLRTVMSRSRRRANRAQFTHDLVDGHVELMFQRQRGFCAISGLPFSLVKFEGVLVKHPFAPSLDRISSHHGYATDNVRLVCIAVNFGMGQWGEELYLTFTRAAVKRSDLAICNIAPAVDTGQRSANFHGLEDNNDVAWFSEQRERIAAAEAVAATLSGEALTHQRRRIASLKRNLTLGPSGLKAAAAKAVRNRATS